MPLILSTGFPEDKKQEISQRLGVPILEPINSVGIKVGALVRQVADIYLSHHPVHYWDSCAPQIILEVAGGRLTYLDGTPLDYSMGRSYEHQKLILASNGLRQRELSRILAR